MFKILLGLAAVILLWFGVSAGSSLWGYMRLQKSSTAKIARVKVVEISLSEYALRVHYEFEGIKGKTVLGKPYYLNQYSAAKAAKGYEHKEVRVWYDPAKPTYNSLEKAFPVKKIIYFFTALAVLLYFYFRLQNAPAESSAAEDIA